MAVIIVSRKALLSSLSSINTLWGREKSADNEGTPEGWYPIDGGNEIVGKESKIALRGGGGGRLSPKGGGGGGGGRRLPENGML